MLNQFLLVLVFASLTALVVLFYYFHRTRKALVSIEKRFQLMADGSADVIFRLCLAPKLHFDYVSPSAENITGFTPEEFYADPGIIIKQVHPDDRPLLKAIRQQGGLFLLPSQCAGYVKMVR